MERWEEGAEDPTGRVLSREEGMGPGWLVEGALSVPGMRGRFGSEHGPVGGRCCGRVGAKCDEGAGCAMVDA